MALTFLQLKKLWGDPICESSIDCNTLIGPICTDSRKLCKGDFFIPLIGEQFDGHTFLEQVFNFGAQAAVISKYCRYSIPKQLTHWIVDDTLEAYQQLGLLHRNCLGIPLIAVTGSVGKTTTRELICAVLAPLGNITSTVGNNNNDIGVPLTLLQADSTHVSIVLEMDFHTIWMT